MGKKKSRCNIRRRAKQGNYASLRDTFGMRTCDFYVPNCHSNTLFAIFQCVLALFATFYFDFGTLNYVVSTASVSRYGQECGREILSNQA